MLTARSFPVPAPLTPWVQSLLLFSGDALDEMLLPIHLGVSLTIGLRDSRARVQLGGANPVVDIPRLFFGGLLTTPAPIRSLGPSDALEVRFRPGAFTTLFRENGLAFTNGVIAVQDVLGRGAAPLEELLAHNLPPERQMAKLVHYLCGAAKQAADPLWGRAAAKLLQAPPQRPVAALLAQLNMNDRTLRRRFEVACGVGPRRLLRIARLRRAVRHLAQVGPRPSRPWSERSVDGYHDQSHFIRDFKAQLGTSPSQFTLPELAALYVGDDD